MAIRNVCRHLWYKDVFKTHFIERFLQAWLGTFRCTMHYVTGSGYCTDSEQFPHHKVYIIISIGIFIFKFNVSEDHACLVHSLLCLPDYLILLQWRHKERVWRKLWSDNTLKGKAFGEWDCPTRLLVGQGSRGVWTWSLAMHHQWWLWHRNKCNMCSMCRFRNRFFWFVAELNRGFELWQELGVQASLSFGVE